MVWHAPSIHFHLGAWAVAAGVSFIAFWLNFMLVRNLVPKSIQEKIFFDDRLVTLLDFAAHISGIVGFLGIIIASYTGLIDAIPGQDPLPDAAIAGYFVSMTESSGVLAFKIIWTIVGTLCFLFTGAVRLYFVTYMKERVYDQNFVVQALYVESQLLGFLIMVVVAGAGGAKVYGESLLNKLPLLSDLMPGGNLLLAITILAVALAAVLVISSLPIARGKARFSIKEERKEVLESLDTLEKDFLETLDEDPEVNKGQSSEEEPT